MKFEGNSDSFLDWMLGLSVALGKLTACLGQVTDMRVEFVAHNRVCGQRYRSILATSEIAKGMVAKYRHGVLSGAFLY
jgi:hypothetical protein